MTIVWDSSNVAPQPQDSLTVACLKVALTHLRQSLDKATTTADASAILDAALLMEHEFGQLANAAAKKVDRLDNTAFAKTFGALKVRA